MGPNRGPNKAVGQLRVRLGVRADATSLEMSAPWGICSAEYWWGKKGKGVGVCRRHQGLRHKMYFAEH